MAFPTPLKADTLRDADLVVVRDLTGGLYFGKPSEPRHGPQGREGVDPQSWRREESALYSATTIR